MIPTFIRAYLEFLSSVWNSMTEREFKNRGDSKERNKMIIELRIMVYWERLEILGLNTLDIVVKEGNDTNNKIIKRMESVGINMRPDKREAIGTK